MVSALMVSLEMLILKSTHQACSVLDLGLIDGRAHALDPTNVRGNVWEFL